MLGLSGPCPAERGRSPPSGTLAPTLQSLREKSCLVPETSALAGSSVWRSLLPASAYQLLPGQQSTSANGTTSEGHASRSARPRHPQRHSLRISSGRAIRKLFASPRSICKCPPARRLTQGEDLASKLKVVIDRCLHRRPAANQQPTGRNAAGRNAAGQATGRHADCRRR